MTLRHLWWAWIAASVAVVIVLWFAFVKSGGGRWTLAGMILSIMLVTPYLHAHDLVLGIVAVALVISATEKISPGRKKAFVIVSFVPVAVSLWTQTVGLRWPVVQVILLGCFVYCAYRAFSGGRQGETGVK